MSTTTEPRQIVDKFGRTWTEGAHGVYRHDSLAWLPWMIESVPRLPPAELAGNPNYRLCDICTADWPKEPTP